MSECVTSSKPCSTCGEVKPFQEFYRDANRRDGYRSACKVCQRDAARERQRRWIEDHRDRRNARNRRRNQAAPELSRGRAQRRWVRLQDDVLVHYGTACSCCGATDDLTIDHVNGDGGEHREELFGDSRRSGTQFYTWLKANGFPAGFQTLCRPCNTSKADGVRCTICH